MNENKNEIYAKELGELIKTETVSELGKENTEKFELFHSVLFKMFPRLFATATTEDFDGSILIRWAGKSDKNPILFMSHHDVVAASGKWTKEPFSGDISDGKVWGRGTLDTKSNLWAFLRAAEELVSDGFVPENDIWFESSCNEETSGEGADRISAELRKRGIKFDFVLDEGGMIVYDPIGGADGTFAMVGVGEKGCADLKFKALSDGGHASTPKKNSPLVRLGKFMAETDKAKCFTVSMSPVISEMMRRMAPTMKGAKKFLMKNSKAFKPLLCSYMPSVSPTAAAMLRTTLAFTMAKGSDGRNVLPQEAYVIGNMRYSHHQGGTESIKAITKLAAKYGVEVEVLDGGFQSEISDFNSDGFKIVEKAVSEVFGDVITSPYIMTGASDCRFFSRVSDVCLRFAPFKIDGQQLASIHGIDENISIDGLSKAVDFYKIIMKSRG